MYPQPEPVTVGALPILIFAKPGMAEAVQRYMQYGAERCVFAASIGPPMRSRAPLASSNSITPGRKAGGATVQPQSSALHNDRKAADAGSLWRRRHGAALPIFLTGLTAA